MKVVIIGGVAGGATAAARIRRLDGLYPLYPFPTVIGMLLAVNSFSFISEYF